MLLPCNWWQNAESKWTCAGVRPALVYSTGAVNSAASSNICDVTHCVAHECKSQSQAKQFSGIDRVHCIPVRASLFFTHMIHTLQSLFYSKRIPDVASKTSANEKQRRYKDDLHVPSSPSVPQPPISCFLFVIHPNALLQPSSSSSIPPLLCSLPLPSRWRLKSSEITAFIKKDQCNPPL